MLLGSGMPVISISMQLGGCVSDRRGCAGGLGGAHAERTEDRSREV